MNMITLVLILSGVSITTVAGILIWIGSFKEQVKLNIKLVCQMKLDCKVCKSALNLKITKLQDNTLSKLQKVQDDIFELMKLIRKLVAAISASLLKLSGILYTYMQIQNKK